MKTLVATFDTAFSKPWPNRKTGQSTDLGSGRRVDHGERGAGDGAAVGRGGLLLLVLALHGGVPVVLDGVVGPARDELGDLGPLVAPLLVRVVDDAVLVLRPCSLERRERRFDKDCRIVSTTDRN